MKNMKVLIVLIIIFILTAAALTAQNRLDLTGTVLHSNNSSAVNYRVFLYADGIWTGPALTDNSGGYAFYDIPPGEYIIVVCEVKNNANNEVWRGKINVPARINPIIVP